MNVLRQGIIVFRWIASAPDRNPAATFTD